MVAFIESTEIWLSSKLMRIHHLSQAKVVSLEDFPRLLLLFCFYLH
jgi:hypothetical protein